jgi:hypothetical protein
MFFFPKNHEKFVATFISFLLFLSPVHHDHHHHHHHHVCVQQYAIKLANKRNEKRLSAITELTTIMTEDQLPKLDTGQIKQEIDRDGRERERAWKFKNNHTNNVSFYSPISSQFQGSIFIFVL